MFNRRALGAFFQRAAAYMALVYLAVLPIALWSTTEPIRRAQSKPFATTRAGETTTIVELTRRIESAEERDRIRALQAARHAIDHAQRLIPQLESFLTSVHADERYWACFALGGLVPHSLDALFAALLHSDARVRVAAAEGIEKSMRPFAKDERLAELDGPGVWLQGDPRTRAVVASTVRIRARGVTELVRALADPADEVRMFTCMSLWKLGSRARAALPALERVRGDASPAVRFWANAAVERVGVSARATVRRLATRMRASTRPATTLDMHALEPLVGELDAPDVWGRMTHARLEWPHERDRRWDACREILVRWLPALEAREQGADDDERRKARDLLARVEWYTMTYLERVFRVLGSEWGTGMRAAREHVALGPAILPVLADDPFRCEHRSYAPCIYAPPIWVLEHLGDDALSLLAMGLEHSATWARPWCAQAIFTRGASALPLIPAIVSAWRTLDDDPGRPGPGNYWDVEQTPFYGDSVWVDMPTNTVDGEPWTMKISDARGLARIGARAVAPLLQALDDPHARVRARAAHALSAFTVDTGMIVSRLAAKLRDEDHAVRTSVSHAILALADPQSPHAREARSTLDAPASDAADSEPAALAARLRSDPSTAWPEFRSRFRRLFESYDESAHATALQMLRAIELVGPAAAPLIPFLLVHTEHVPVQTTRPWRDLGAAQWARVQLHDALARALGAMGAAGIEYLARRATEITDRDATPRLARAWIPRVRASNGDTIQRLFELHARSDERMWPWIALSIANLGSPASEVLVARLAGAERSVRLDAARIARAFGEQHELVAAHVRPLLDSADAGDRALATFALGGLTPASLPALIDALAHPDVDVRVLAAEAIEKATSVQIEPSTRDFAILRSADLDAARLHEIASPRGIAALGRALSDGDERVRVFAAMSLWKLGNAAVPARDALRAAELDASRAVRLWSRSARERTFDSPRATLHRLARTWRTPDAARSVTREERARLVRELDAPSAWTPGQRVRALPVDRRFDALKALVSTELTQLEAEEHSDDKRGAAAAREILSKLEGEATAYLARLGAGLEEWIGFDARGPAELVALGGAALPTITRHLFRDVPSSRDKYEQHVVALMALGDEGVPALAIGLEHASEVGRMWCAQSLARLGERAAPASLALISAWRSLGEHERAPGTQTYWRAEHAPYANGAFDGSLSPRAAHLGAFGALVSASHAPFVDALRDPLPSVREHAAHVLRELDANAAACALPELERLLDDTCDSVRRAAAESYVALGATGSAKTLRAQVILAAPPAK